MGSRIGAALAVLWFVAACGGGGGGEGQGSGGGSGGSAGSAGSAGTGGLGGIGGAGGTGGEGGSAGAGSGGTGGASGSGGSGGESCPGGCDDADPCTRDTCEAGTCSHRPIDLSDHNGCTFDACDPITGAITHEPLPIDDGDACTEDACDPATGAITHEPLPIDDNDICTADACDSATGAVTHELLPRDDGDACTDDGCDPTTGPYHLPLAAIDDRNGCTIDSCDPFSGAIAHDPRPIDDTDACTLDTCNPATGAITHVPINPTDQNVCTSDRCDPSVGPIHDPIDIADADLCTIDSCDPVTGISHQPMPVDDGIACTWDTCSDGVVTHEPRHYLCPAENACTDLGCIPRQRLAFTELAVVGPEAIELKNAGLTTAELTAFRLGNGAGAFAAIHAASDPTGALGHPVLVAPSAYAWGVPNPADPAEIPAGAAFVYGAPGTGFSLDDSGDRVALVDVTGYELDSVDFTELHTDPTLPIPATAFPAIAQRTTQIDQDDEHPALNNQNLHWCVSYRAANTLGAQNEPCTGAVRINEIARSTNVPSPLTSSWIDTDDGNTFVELAGPPGARMENVRLNEVDGRYPFGGSRRTENPPDAAPGEIDGEVVLPQGLRMPLDGLLVVADGRLDGTTSVPNADVIVRDMDLADSGADGLQMVWSPTGPLLDAVGWSGPFDGTITRFNSLPYFEGMPASRGPLENGSLARDGVSTDTDDNDADFHLDPTPTPGLPNDPVVVTVSSLFPANGSADYETNVTFNGTDLTPDMFAVFGSHTAVPCLVSTNDASAVVCRAPRNGGVIGPVDVRLIPASYMGGPGWFGTGAFMYSTAVNESDTPEEADFCITETPDFSAVTGTQIPPIVGTVLEAGLTEGAGASPDVIFEVGYGTLNSDPRGGPSWSWFPATFVGQVGDSDRYEGTFVAPPAARLLYYSFGTRVSFDGGLHWTLCDENGSGSSPGHTLWQLDMPTLTVTP